MEYILSYGTKITSDRSAMNTMIKQLCKIYTEAVSFLADVCKKEYESGELRKGEGYCVNIIEPLVHKTKSNPSPKYDFDTRFPNFPSYLLRAAIARAYGAVSSWVSNCLNWEDNGRKGKKPSFPTFRNETPQLYFSNMFVFVDEKGNRLPKGELSEYAMIKVYCNQRQLLQDSALTKDVKKKIKKGKLDPAKMVWDWLPVHLKHSDVTYLKRKQAAGCEINSPSILRRGKRCELCFSVKGNVSFEETDPIDMTIVAVDLGINTPAACTVMRADGSILARRFFKSAKETGCLNHRIGRISRAQSHGSVKTPTLWRMADHANQRLSDSTASFIVDLAEEFHAGVIVFEHLDTGGKKRGGKKARLHHWRAKYVRQLVESRAHAKGIRISRICAWGTSRLAFDGSGRVSRGVNGNYSVCSFQSGKIYNCDLSASYNIGARYFIREILKTLSETRRSELVAKVPELSKRSTCTLSSLIKLNAVLCPEGHRMPEDGKMPQKASAA